MPPLPRVTPQLCRAATEPPGGSGWIHEIKQDGHRIIATIEKGRVRLWGLPSSNAIRSPTSSETV
jgi:bifunctional non-homologous end joining protein LigD